METIIAVILAVLIVAGVFVAAICIALMKKSKDGQKTSRTNSGVPSTRTNQYTNNLTAGNSNPRPNAANMENNRHPIGVFHIHLNGNSQSHTRHNINNTQQKTAHEEPPPAYFDLFPQDTSPTDEYSHQQV